MKRECIECGNEFIGRADKKFCDDFCRNAYHNKNNRGDSAFVRNVNKILLRNRKILESFNPEDKAKVHRNKLVNNGFNFNYFTSTYTTKAGTTYYFCYEKGYLPLENEWFALVTNNELR